LNQDAGQAAIWHLNNDMPWEQLASKTTPPQQGTPFVRPYFTPQQLMVARHSIERVMHFVKENKVEFLKPEAKSGMTSEGKNASKEAENEG